MASTTAAGPLGVAALLLSCMVILQLVLPVSGQVVYPTPPPSRELNAHPRLILTTSRQQELKLMLNAPASYTDLGGISYIFNYHANWVRYQAPVLNATMAALATKGTSALQLAQNARDYMLTAALAHTVRSDPANTTYLDRAALEARQLCIDWYTWNVKTDGLTAGFAMQSCALVYDWLYNDFNTTFRNEIASALVRKGLEPLRASVFTRYDYVNGFFWINSSSNWNTIVSCGGLLAALAIYGDNVTDSSGASVDEWLFPGIITPLITSVSYVAKMFLSDGSAQEGPSYHTFNGQSWVYILTALKTALGSTAGLGDYPGSLLVGRYSIYATGAGNLNGLAMHFNWADCGLESWRGVAPALMGLGDPATNFFQRTLLLKGTPSWLHKSPNNGMEADALLFYDYKGNLTDLLVLPTSVALDDHTAFFRGPWTSSLNYLGFKGGDTSYSHNHLDHGSFVYDFAGVRFAEDLGADSYSIPQYFSDVGRRAIYRLSTRGHNSAMFGGISHSTTAVSNIIAMDASEYVLSKFRVTAFSIVNLTNAYAASASCSSYLRGFVSVSLLDGSAVDSVLIIDEVVFLNSSSSVRPANMTWQLHTQAAFSIPSPTGTVKLWRTTYPSYTVTSAAGFRDYNRTLFAEASLKVLNEALTWTNMNLSEWKSTDVNSQLGSSDLRANGYYRIDAVFPSPVNACGKGMACRVTVALGNRSVISALSDAVALNSLTLLPLSAWEVGVPPLQDVISPSESPSPSPLPTSSASGSASPSFSPTASPSESPSSSASSSASSSITPSMSANATADASPNLTATASSSITPSMSANATADASPNVTATASSSITPSMSANATAATSPNVTATTSSSPSPSRSANTTAARSPNTTTATSFSITPSRSATRTVTVSSAGIAASPTNAVTPSGSATITSAWSLSVSASVSPTTVRSPTSSPTMSLSRSRSVSTTATRTASMSAPTTATIIQSRSPSATAMSTGSGSSSASSSATAAPPVSGSSSASSSATAAPTVSGSSSANSTSSAEVPLRRRRQAWSCCGGYYEVEE